MDGIVFCGDNKNELVRMQSDRHVQSSILRAMYEDDSLYNVTLYGAPPPDGDSTTYQRPIRAYKNILAHASRHLYDLFTVDGFDDSHRSEYKIGDVNHEVLRVIVQFIHTDELVLNASNAIDHVCDILIAAKFLVMPKLADACEGFLAGDKHFTLSNCVHLWCFARKHLCLELMHACSLFIAEHVDEMARNAQFLNMPYNDCAKLLMCEAFIDANAEERYRAALAWLSYDGDGRVAYVCDVLNMVPFTSGELSIDIILDAEGNEFLQENASVMIRSAMKNALNKTRSRSACSSNDRTQVCNDNWYAVGGNRHYKWFFQYDILRRSWTALKPLPWGRTYAGTCAVRKRLFVFGGMKESELKVEDVSLDIDEYDLATEKWSISKSKLGLARCSLLACGDGRQSAYAIGGHGEEAVNIMEKYDCGDGGVTQLSGMLTERHNFAAVYSTAYNCIFVAGGSNSSDAECIEKYDVYKDEWSKVGEMEKPRYGLSAALSGDDLYLMGGDGENGSVVETFNLQTGQTRHATNLLNARRGCQATTLHDGKILCVLGGYNNANLILNTVETFDVREGKWSTGEIVPNMPVGLAYFGLAAV